MLAIILQGAQVRSPGLLGDYRVVDRMATRPDNRRQQRLVTRNSCQTATLMLPRWCLTTFVFALPILAISFGVFLGAAELMRALGDTGGAYGMRVVAIIILLLLLIDGLCLLIALGLAALIDQDHE